MSNIPSSLSYIQIEGAEFRRPVSEGLVQAIGGTTNGLLDFRTAQLAVNAAILAYFIPVGTIVPSMLTESQFNGQLANLIPPDVGWVLADGRDVSGSLYNTVSGNSHVPDLRGEFLRGKDHGSGRNPDGDTALGAVQGFAIQSHTHTASSSGNFTDQIVNPHNNGSDIGRAALSTTITSGTIPVTVTTTVNPTGGPETRPSNVTVNYFIRIN